MTESSDDDAQAGAKSEKTKHAVPSRATAKDSEPTAEPVDGNPVDKETEQAKAEADPAASALGAVAPQLQQAQAEQQVTGSESAAGSPGNVGTGQQAGQLAGAGDPSQKSTESVDHESAAQSTSLAGGATDSPTDIGTGAFADGLEEALKKIESHSDTGQPAAGSTPASAMAPALVGAGNDRIAQSQSSLQASQGQATVAPEQQFVEANHGSIVNDIQTRLMPGGGTMQIRLSPPELGAMQVRVEMHGETLAATFQTSTDQAAQLLTSGLGQLKQALEQQGISVGRLQVVRTPQNDGARTGNDSGQSATQWQGYQQQQNDQRREVLRQLWDRVAYGRDPIDLMA